VDLYGRADLRHPPALVFAAVSDLATYPGWLGIVMDVEAATPHADDDGLAWFVDLGARLGPVRRTKRVRMVRTIHEPETRARFDREEHDAEAHSAWTLSAAVDTDEGAQDACRLRMDLHYGGAGWFPGLDLVLRQEIRRAGGRLNRYLALRT
jgi:hypothetical protein